MALVTSAWVMAQSEQMLTAGARFRSPRLSAAEEGLHIDLTPSNPDVERPLLRRKHSWDKAPGPPRNRKRIFNYNVDPEMETYKGHVRAPADAIVLFEACRLGLLPRVQRRLSEKERQSIKSGSVFVWDEREAGMRRWTDGKSWSASRVSGSFLTYREMEGKRGGGSTGFPATPVTARTNGARTPESGRGNESEMDGGGGDEGPDGYRYKPDGLMKQSFSITTSTGNHLHLISYYSRSHPASQQLPTPSTDPSLRHIRPVKGMYPESTVHEHQNIPAVTRSPMATSEYRTVPVMASYARNPPHGQIAWPSPHAAAPPAPPLGPPSQQAPPPGYQYPYTGPAYYSNPPPPGQSPVSRSMTSQYAYGPPPPAPSSQHSSHPNPPYDDRRYPPSSPVDPNLAPGDPRRQQPIDNHPQPPPNHLPDTAYGHPPQEGPPPSIYDPKGYPPRSAPPPPSDNRPPPAQYSSQHSRPPSSGYPSQAQHYHPPPPNAYHPDPRYQQQPLPPHHSGLQHPGAPSSPYAPSNAPGLHIDPRLTASSHRTQDNSAYPGDQSRHPPSYAPRAANGVAASQSETRGAQPASTVPSIGLLVNGSADRGYNSDTTRSPPRHATAVNGHMATSGKNNIGSTSTADYSADRSPNPAGGKKNEGPQDIPSDKVGFSEDMRALKVLDKGFR